jgi:flagellar hook-basal body complex protein FliE
MNIEPAGFLPPSSLTGIDLTAPVSGSGNFAGWLARQVGQVNGQILEADQMVSQLALGRVDNLHQVMISLEQARVSFQLFAQVRNKLLEAYQDVLRMQV